MIIAYYSVLYPDTTVAVATRFAPLAKGDLILLNREGCRFSLCKDRWDSDARPDGIYPKLELCQAQNDMIYPA